jgi:hypothetical protein
MTMRYHAAQIGSLREQKQFAGRLPTVQITMRLFRIR